MHDEVPLTCIFLQQYSGPSSIFVSNPEAEAVQTEAVRNGAKAVQLVKIPAGAGVRAGKEVETRIGLILRRWQCWL